MPQKATTKADSYIIVASLATNSDAMQVVKQMQQKGYKEAQISNRTDVSVLQSTDILIRLMHINRLKN